VFGGKPRKILEAVFQEKIQICLSQAITDELTEVLRRQEFTFRTDMVHNLVTEVLAIAEYVEPLQQIRAIPEDPDDDRILECAVAAGARYIITGDRHLLKLIRYEDIEIVNADQFLDLL
jgi:putative PIN family toxin of toxin-antitoxin system